MSRGLSDGLRLVRQFLQDSVQHPQHIVFQPCQIVPAFLNLETLFFLRCASGIFGGDFHKFGQTRRGDRRAEADQRPTPVERQVELCVWKV